VANLNHPFHPIIYVRGYAMTRSEIDLTTADPFCGFNIGSTIYRAAADKDRQPRKFIFESPLVRLASDFGYRDVYEDGRDILDPDWTAPRGEGLQLRSVIVYRYYDEASRLLRDAKTPSMEAFAENLGVLVLRIRDLVCTNPDNAVAPDDFRCYLVAHSMGGLVCRAFMQNPALDPNGASRFVDKLFTYATPHNGIEMAGLNVPAELMVDELSNFNRDRMAHYLDLGQVFKDTGRVDWLPEDRFPSRRVFCMVGTNRNDYEVALGMSRTFVGHGSDGLVRIENATLYGRKADGSCEPCAKAFTYRSHSGFFGIVNSEEAYQNLIRFLFGDVRIDIWLDFDEITLPQEVQQEADKGRRVNALYQVELLASPRGKLWYLTRRIAEEDSVACLSHEDWTTDPKAHGTLYLSSVFLANRARVNPNSPTLSYAVTLSVRIPDYEIDRKLWVNTHYEGGYLFRNSLVVSLTPPQGTATAWTVTYGWQDKGVKPATSEIAASDIGAGRVSIKIPVDSESAPGIKGTLRFVIAGWNLTPR
jgi:hypothetical protein